MDSYEKFIKRFNIKKEDLYIFGIEETIYPPIHNVEKYWNGLKERILNNEEVYIRGYGRDAAGTKLYLDLYKFLFNNDSIKKDPTNNSKPQKIIELLTGYRRNKNLFNYQVSHIWGKTKNIFLFEAPWNIVFVPKIIDPFTGHETKGDWPIEYQKYFLNSAEERYRMYIQEYNYMIDEYKISERIEEYLLMIKEEVPPKKYIQFQKDARVELSKIEL